MKKSIVLFIAVVATALTAFSQVTQNFESVSALGSLSSNCWEFQGASLVSTTGGKQLSLTPQSVGGTASVRTPYINLNIGSTISFTYKLSETVTHSTHQTIQVSLQGADGIITLLGSVALDHSVAPSSPVFTAFSPLSGTQKVLVEVISTSNELASVYVDNMVIDGNFNFSSPYGCKDQSANPVSIHYLKNFSGLLQNNKVQLQWTVAENDNNNYFEIERSTDGTNFKNIGVVSASSKPAEESYTWSEVTQTSGYYRLRVVNKNSVPMYSSVLVFKNKTNIAAALTLMQNPVQQSLNFSFVSECKTAATLTVYNLSGIAVFQTTLPAQRGYNVLSTPLTNQIRKGMYLLEIVYGAERSAVKFIKE